MRQVPDWVEAASRGFALLSCDQQGALLDRFIAEVRAQTARFREGIRESDGPALDGAVNGLLARALECRGLAADGGQPLEAGVFAALARDNRGINGLEPIVLVAARRAARSVGIEV